MISHAPQDEGLVQGSDNKDGVMVLSVTADGLSSPEEAEVAGPSVRLAHIAATDQPGCEVVRISSVLTVHGVISAGVVRTLDPDLSEVAVPALTLRLGVRDDDIDPGEELAGLHEGEGVGTASLHERD